MLEEIGRLVYKHQFNHNLEETQGLTKEKLANIIHNFETENSKNRSSERHSNQTEKFQKTFENADEPLIRCWNLCRQVPPLRVRKELAFKTNLSPKKIYNWFIRQMNYDGFNFGDWQQDEHQRYKEAVAMYGQNWKKI